MSLSYKLNLIGELFLQGVHMDIFVGNIPFSATEDELQSLFSEYGEVSAVKIIKDRETGRSRGFAFVTMSNDDEANEAIDKINNREMNGRPLKVNQSRPKN